MKTEKSNEPKKSNYDVDRKLLQKIEEKKEGETDENKEEIKKKGKAVIGNNFYGVGVELESNRHLFNFFEYRKPSGAYKLPLMQAYKMNKESKDIEEIYHMEFDHTVLETITQPSYIKGENENEFCSKLNISLDNAYDSYTLMLGLHAMWNKFLLFYSTLSNYQDDGEIDHFQKKFMWILSDKPVLDNNDHFPIVRKGVETMLKEFLTRAFSSSNQLSEGWKQRFIDILFKELKREVDSEFYYEKTFDEIYNALSIQSQDEFNKYKVFKNKMSSNFLYDEQKDANIKDFFYNEKCAIKSHEKFIEVFNAKAKEEWRMDLFKTLSNTEENKLKDELINILFDEGRSTTKNYLSRAIRECFFIDEPLILLAFNKALNNYNIKFSKSLIDSKNFPKGINDLFSKQVLRLNIEKDWSKRYIPYSSYDIEEDNKKNSVTCCIQYNISLPFGSLKNICPITGNEKWVKGSNVLSSIYLTEVDGFIDSITPNKLQADALKEAIYWSVNSFNWKYMEAYSVLVSTPKDMFGILTRYRPYQLHNIVVELLGKLNDKQIVRVLSEIHKMATEQREQIKNAIEVFFKGKFNQRTETSTYLLNKGLVDFYALTPKSHINYSKQSCDQKIIFSEGCLTIKDLLAKYDTDEFTLTALLESIKNNKICSPLSKDKFPMYIGKSPTAIYEIRDREFLLNNGSRYATLSFYSCVHNLFYNIKDKPNSVLFTNYFENDAAFKHIIMTHPYGIWETEDLVKIATELLLKLARFMKAYSNPKAGFLDKKDNESTDELLKRITNAFEKGTHDCPLIFEKNLYKIIKNNNNKNPSLDDSNMSLGYKINEVIFRANNLPIANELSDKRPLDLNDNKVSSDDNVEDLKFSKSDRKVSLPGILSENKLELVKENLENFKNPSISLKVEPIKDEGQPLEYIFMDTNSMDLRKELEAIDRQIVVANSKESLIKETQALIVIQKAIRTVQIKRILSGEFKVKLRDGFHSLVNSRLKANLQEDQAEFLERVFQSAFWENPVREISTHNWITKNIKKSKSMTSSMMKIPFNNENVFSKMLLDYQMTEAIENVEYDEIISLKAIDFQTIAISIPFDRTELVMNVLRYENGLKNNGDITFDPIHLKNIKSEDVKYEVTAFIQHIGTTPYGGHYVTYIKEQCGRWFSYNDREITCVEDEGIRTRALKEAYIVKYASDKAGLPAHQTGTTNKGNNCWLNASLAFINSFTSVTCLIADLTEKDSIPLPIIDFEYPQELICEKKLLLKVLLEIPNMTFTDIDVYGKTIKKRCCELIKQLFKESIIKVRKYKVSGNMSTYIGQSEKERKNMFISEDDNLSENHLDILTTILPLAIDNYEDTKIQDLLSELMKPLVKSKSLNDQVPIHQGIMNKKSDKEVSSSDKDLIPDCIEKAPKDTNYKKGDKENISPTQAKTSSNTIEVCDRILLMLSLDYPKVREGLVIKQKHLGLAKKIISECKPKVDLEINNSNNYIIKHMEEVSNMLIDKYNNIKPTHLTLLQTILPLAIDFFDRSTIDGWFNELTEEEPSSKKIIPDSNDDSIDEKDQDDYDDFD
jgi:hypothetical protein